MMKIIVDAKYKGYLAIEWEGKKLQPNDAIHASKKLIASSLKEWGQEIV